MRRSTAALLAMALVTVTSCAEANAQRRARSLAGPALEVVDVELVGLNGRENDGREPMVTMLLRAPRAESGTPVEAALGRLRDQGWRLAPAQSGDWWSWEGQRGSWYGRLGAATDFVAMAKGAEGYAPTAFERAVSAEPGGLVVFAADRG